MPKLNPAILGACGEYFVASFLSGSGLVVALTRRGVPASDMLITSDMGGQSISLQVKSGGVYSRTTYKKDPEKIQWTWRVGNKDAVHSNDSHWFAFVFIGEWPLDGDNPDVFFVPSKFVIERAYDPATNDGWFWMMETEAKGYRGLKGCEMIKKAIARRR
jgi:hypothetical protein